MAEATRDGPNAEPAAVDVPTIGCDLFDLTAPNIHTGVWPAQTVRPTEPGPYVPLWRRIRQDILDRIDAGILKPGDKLPTTKELAVQYDTSGVTVRKAIEILIEAGTLEGRQGIGVFVAAGSSQRA
ncbi:GntR family transcriptional regulator [Micromonospora peucetia]|uniref:GntR family transcriptional regulator n=1 Tax=Micromonospora peucetia TaxID=47871 RepID=UPI003320057C